jgi:hypothetical protein
MIIKHANNLHIFVNNVRVRQTRVETPRLKDGPAWKFHLYQDAPAIVLHKITKETNLSSAGPVANEINFT